MDAATLPRRDETTKGPRSDGSYATRRAELEHYFDRTAAEQWQKLTSDAPVSRIRATVRAGRDRMRSILLARLGDDLSARTVLDAGCGTGALAAEAAARGAAVTAVDLSSTLIDTARERNPQALPEGAAPQHGQIAFAAGDMLDAARGEFDHVVAMDSLIHYRAADIVAVLSALAPRVRRSVVFTIAPRTPLLTAMHTAGKLFPRSDRAPAIAPVAPRHLARLIAREPALAAFRFDRIERVISGFYTSEAVELVRR